MQNIDRRYVVYSDHEAYWTIWSILPGLFLGLPVAIWPIVLVMGDFWGRVSIKYLSMKNVTLWAYLIIRFGNGCRDMFPQSYIAGNR